MLRLIILLLTAVVLCGQAGCGQSGPLYLPNDDPSTMVESSAGSTAGNDEDEDVLEDSTDEEQQ